MSTKPLDLRDALWSGCPWFDSLERPVDETPSAWFLAKGDPSAWYVAVANIGIHYCRARGLESHYRKHFEAIAPKDLSNAKARAERRSPAFPIWELLNELIAAAFLESILGWQFDAHEPPGHRQSRGDWQFITECGQKIFVEVKSIGEAEVGEWVGTRASRAPRIRAILKRAYRQLPDNRPTVVVIAGNNSEALRAPFGIAHSDLFHAFFGETIVRMKFDGVEMSEPRLGPSFREMFVHREKHSRLGAAIGLNLTGIGAPLPLIYAIQNPFARPECQLDRSTIDPIHRFAIEGERGTLLAGLSPEQTWECVASSPFSRADEV